MSESNCNGDLLNTGEALVTTRLILYLHQTRLYEGGRHQNYFQSHRIIHYTCSLIIDIQCNRFKNAFIKRFLRIVCKNNSAKINSEKNCDIA